MDFRIGQPHSSSKDCLVTFRDGCCFQVSQVISGYSWSEQGDLLRMRGPPCLSWKLNLRARRCEGWGEEMEAEEFGIFKAVKRW